MSDIFSKFDRIIGNSSLVSFSIKDSNAFTSIKSDIERDLLKTLDTKYFNYVILPPLTKRKKDKTASMYCYIFKNNAVNCEEKDLIKIVAYTSLILGKYKGNNTLSECRYARKELKTFYNRGLIYIDQTDENKILTKIELNNILLLIRIADHSRRDLESDILKELENLKYLFDKDDIQNQEEFIENLKDLLAQFDARKMIVPEERYFDLEECEEVQQPNQIFSRYGSSRIKNDFNNYLKLLERKPGISEYDKSKLSNMLNRIFNKKFDDELIKNSIRLKGH